MAHQTVKSGYTELGNRLNQHPQGAPPSDVLYAILKLLFSKKEASLVALLPAVTSTLPGDRDWLQW